MKKSIIIINTLVEIEPDDLNISSDNETITVKNFFINGYCNPLIAKLTIDSDGEPAYLFNGRVSSSKSLLIKDMNEFINTCIASTIEREVGIMAEINLNLNKKVK